MRIENSPSIGTNPHLASILLVDDSAVNLGVVVEGFESQGYDVLVAMDGEEALQRVELAMPDLILLDVMMPGMDGFEVCRRLKAQERTRDIPVIFMTSLSGIDDKMQGFAAGAVDYITKPLQVNEARARVHTHLELRALRQRLETKNHHMQLEIAERQKAEEALRDKIAHISALNERLEEQAVELEASQEQLRLTEAWYRGIVRSAPDGMMVVDAQGRISLVNEHLEKVFGYAEGELIGQPMEILLPPDTRGSHVAKRDGFFAGGTMGRPMDAIDSGFRGCRKDGTEFPVDVSLSRLPPAEDRSGVICAAIRDITERRRMEDALAIREQEFRTLLENTPDVVVRYDLKCRRTYVNPAFVQVNGFSAQEIIGKTPQELSSRIKPVAARYEQMLRGVMTSGRPDSMDLAWMDEAGHQVCFEQNAIPEFDSNGKVVSVLTVARDIS
ncbi:MAG TPA: PAS domain S-box protein, partial [Gallionella sp.]|nr:PAS domain S-box protein [Gallionella sp.]